MFPKWYSKWNEDNPTDIYGPAILMGAAIGAVVFAVAVIMIGNPAQTSSMQTGPRGTGMHVPEFNYDLARGDETVEGFVSIPPIANPGPTLAGNVYDNAPPALALVPADNYERLVESMQAWTGIPDLLDNPDSYQTEVAHAMIRMTQEINEFWGGHVNANGEVGVTCYTCHRGQPVPNNIWFRVGEVNAAADGWPAIQNRATMTSNYSSLPSTYLETYFFPDEDGFYARIGVHDLASRVENLEGDPLIQETERTYALMNYFANSLGVNCVFCHNSRAFYDGAQVTLQWGTALQGISMVQEIVDVHLLPLQDVYPPERLGPVFQDAPLAACKTCHQGYQQPLQGLNVIGNYPELATTSGEYDYSVFE